MRDLAIIGGGPVGLAAALAAHRDGLSPIVLEARREPPGGDPRVFALSYGARLILEGLGAWTSALRPSPIEVVHVSQRGRFGHTVLTAGELGLPELGYVVSQADLVGVLREAIASAGVPVIGGARVTGIDGRRRGHVAVDFERDGASDRLQARVVAQADGGAGLVEGEPATERDYAQCAVLAEVACSRADAARAYERFTGRGPIALLPRGRAHALVWTVPLDQGEPLATMAGHEFEAALAQAYGERLGTVRLLGGRASFRLRLRYAQRITGERRVLIGNAAQTLHPVAGQGFNLGLRDAHDLAQALSHGAARAGDPAEGLRRYRAARRLDRSTGTFFTDALVRAFGNDDPLLAAARSAGLFLLDASGAPKRFLMRRMIFGTPG